MSLQVWLPLNGDLKNQGLSNVTITNNGATVDNNGKIGKCYSLDGTDDHIQIANLSNPKNISVAFWMKRNATTNTRQFMFTAWGGVTCEMTTTNYIHCYVNGGNGACDSTYVVTADTDWTHVVYTFEDGVGGKLYLNGVLNRTTSSSGSINWTTTTGNIGKFSNMYYNGKINDFRIYDHALSAKEIKEISKGLVAHYCLNGNGLSNKNYLKNSNFLQGTNGMEGYTAASATCTKQTDCMKVVSTSTSGGFYTPNYDSITTGDIATFSAWVKADNSMAIYIGVDGSGNGSCQAYSIGTAWQKISISKAKTTNNPQPRIYGNGTFYVKLMKYELGAVATPWCPNPADAAYTSMGYNSTTEYDVSGNNYHGTKIGTFENGSETPRYSVNTNLKSTSTYIKISNLNTTGFANSYSFAWWGNVNSYSGLMMWGFRDGIRLNGIFNGNLWNTGDGSNNPLYTPGTTTQVSAPTSNVWHHFVMTGDGTTCKVYKDGELWATAKTYKAISGTEIIINGWDYGTTYKYSNYYMSDFRIYATALSANDVKELYELGASVDKNGNTFAYEFVEV